MPTGHMTPLPPPPPNAWPVDEYSYNQMRFNGSTEDDCVPRRLYLISLIVTTFISFLIGVLVSSGFDNPNPTADLKVTSEEILIAPADSESLHDEEIPLIVDQVSKSVVSIVAGSSKDEFAASATGTGLIISTDGEIITNAHVIEGATEVRVRLMGESDSVIAEVISSDMSNDLALLKIDRRGLTAATFASPDSIDIGQRVLAVGFALDLSGGASVTSGIISAENRTIETSGGALNKLLQTDAAISSGNSGGPLVNYAGEVVGINTAVYRSSGTSEANNIGFAISSGEVIRVIGELRESGVKRRQVAGFLGVTLMNRNDGGIGAIISEVLPDTAADRSGLVPGDIVISAGGAPVEDTLDLVAAIKDLRAGDDIEIVVIREGEEITIDATLGIQPSS